MVMRAKVECRFCGEFFHPSIVEEWEAHDSRECVRRLRSEVERLTVVNEEIAGRLEASVENVNVLLNRERRLKPYRTEALAARHLVYADGSASPVADLPFPFEAKTVYAKARAANEDKP